MSNGMIMCASSEDKKEIELVRPADGSQVGERVQLEGIDKFSEEKQTQLNPKKKIENKMLELLKTNDNCEVIYNGVKLVTENGVAKVQSLKNKSVS